jgi:hypothetical protein
VDNTVKLMLLETIEELMKKGRCPPIRALSCTADKVYCANRVCWAQFIQDVIKGKIIMKGSFKNESDKTLH